MLRAVILLKGKLKDCFLFFQLTVCLCDRYRDGRTLCFESVCRLYACTLGSDGRLLRIVGDGQRIGGRHLAAFVYDGKLIIAEL